MKTFSVLAPLNTVADVILCLSLERSVGDRFPLTFVGVIVVVTTPSGGITTSPQSIVPGNFFLLIVQKH